MDQFLAVMKKQRRRKKTDFFSGATKPGKDIAEGES